MKIKINYLSNTELLLSFKNDKSINFIENESIYSNQKCSKIILSNEVLQFYSDKNTIKCFINYLFDFFKCSEIYIKKYITNSEEELIYFLSESDILITNKFTETNISLCNYYQRIYDYMKKNNYSNRLLVRYNTHFEYALFKNKLFCNIIDKYFESNDINFYDYAGGIGAISIELYLNKKINNIFLFDLNIIDLKFSKNICEYLNIESKINIERNKHNILTDEFRKTEKNSIINITGILYLFENEQILNILDNAYKSLFNGIIVFNTPISKLKELYSDIINKFGKINIEIITNNGLCINIDNLKISNIFKSFTNLHNYSVIINKKH